MEDSIPVWKLSPEASKTVEAFALPAATFDDATRALPQGGYTTFRTFGKTGVLRLEDHFERMEETAALAGSPLSLNRARIREALRMVLSSAKTDEARVRIILDLTSAPGTLYILLAPLRTPPEQAYRLGVRAITRKMQRENPRAKVTEFITATSQMRRSMPEGINEVIMIGEDGRMLEGLSSNFFAVVAGELWTAEEGVLAGITRSAVLESTAALGIPIRPEGLPHTRLGEASEAFITSASRAVLPITQIDGAPVGNAAPGPLTLRLLGAYRERLVAEVEAI
jgi:branched-chain amino acid aminotransferase